MQNGEDVSGQSCVVSGAPSSGAEAPPSPHGGEGNRPGRYEDPLAGGEGTRLSLMTPFGREVEEWAGAAGKSVESLCVELEVSQARLTRLTKEYCGLTVQELVDGFKVRQLRGWIGMRLREAAQALWGAPGSYAAVKYEGNGDRQPIPQQPGIGVSPNPVRHAACYAGCYCSHDF